MNQSELSVSVHPIKSKLFFFPQSIALTFDEVWHISLIISKEIMLQRALTQHPAVHAPDVLNNMYTISGDNVPKHPVVQHGDSSGHGNLVAW